MKAIDLAIRFLLELCALIALGYAGYQAPVPEVGKIAIAIAAPLALAVLWSLFAAHKAKYPPPGVWKAVVGMALLEAAALALALVGRGLLAGVFAAVIVLNSALVYRLDRP